MVKGKLKKGMKKCNNAKNMKICKVGDIMTTTKTSKTSQNPFDDKRIYVNSIKSYTHNENLYLFKKDLINNFNSTPIEISMKLGLDKDNQTNL